MTVSVVGTAWRTALPLLCCTSTSFTLGTRSPNLVASFLMHQQWDRWQALLSHQASSYSAIFPAVHSLPTSITRLQNWSAALAHLPEQTMKRLC